MSEQPLCGPLNWPQRKERDMADERHVPMAGTDWRVEPLDDGSGAILYVTEDVTEETVVIPREHAAAIAVAAGYWR